MFRTFMLRGLSFLALILAFAFASGIALADKGDSKKTAPQTEGPATCQTFTDVSPELESRAVCLSCMGIISGYADGTFRPSMYITRGQLAKIVANAAQFTEEHATQTFSDVPIGSTFHQYIERLASRSVIRGYDDGTFRPGNWVTRGQTAKILAAVLPSNGLPYDQIFADVPWGHPFFFSANKLWALGVMRGYVCGAPYEPCDSQSRPYFRPSWSTTRGEIVANIVYGFFRYECSSEELGK